MQTLSYGYKKPVNPDTGDTWFPAMEANIQQLNDHNHDGTNSAFIATQPSQLPTTQAVSSVNWGATLGGGLYRQLITMPGTLTFDTKVITMRTSAGIIVYAQIEKVSSNTFYVYTNDNTQNFVAYYN